MSIIEKKLQAVEKLRVLDLELQNKLIRIATTCEEVKNEMRLDGSKSEDALKRQYAKVIDSCLKKLANYINY